MKKKKKVMYGSFGGGGAILVIGILAYLLGAKSIGSALFVGGIIGSFLPYGLFSYFRNRYFQALEKEFPNFLRDIAESKKSGRSIPQAIRDAKDTDYGRLNEEIDKIANQISWGISLPEVLERFSHRMEGSELIRRSLSIIIQSYRSGGNISETMEAISKDASKIKEAQEERSSTLYQQVVVIYVIYFMFVGIILALSRILVPLMNLSSGVSTNILGGGATNFCSIDLTSPLCSLCPTLNLGSPQEKMCYYKALFFFMVIIEGVFNGLVAGQIEEDTVVAGVKHALLMLPIGFLAFIIFV